MSTDAAPSHLACQLPADAYHQLIRTLRLTLPPPLTDAPEDLARRDHAAIARIAALAPANAVEADLAAQFVAASEQWKDCLRLAQGSDATPEWARKCRAQANSMMRQANSALRLLLRVQDARRKLEADAAAADRLAWTEHCAVSLIAEALAAQPTPAPRRDTETAEPAEPATSEPGSTPANLSVGAAQTGRSPLFIPLPPRRREASDDFVRTPASRALALTALDRASGEARRT